MRDRTWRLVLNEARFNHSTRCWLVPPLTHAAPL
jgi:hypothetical protein